jgi:SEC-C motif-containing protein
MRSRFSAYARGEAEYLWRTLHADHADRAAPKEETLRAMKRASAHYRYMRLRILDAKGAHVLFRASVFEKGKDRSFIELSTFAPDGVGWRYVDGITRPADGTAWTIDSFVSAPDVGPV